MHCQMLAQSGPCRLNYRALAVFWGIVLFGEDSAFQLIYHFLGIHVGGFTPVGDCI